MKLLIILSILFVNLTFAKEIASIKGQKIYGCFNEINTPKEKSFTLILRNNNLKSADSLINLKENKNSILVLKKYKSDIRESFETSSLNFSSTGPKFKDIQDGWEPQAMAETIFTARADLKAFSIQNKVDGFFVAQYSEYSYKDIQLICTTNENFVNELFMKAISN